MDPNKLAAVKPREYSMDDIKTRASKLTQIPGFQNGVTKENGIQLYKRAYDSGLSLSEYLETVDPSDAADPLDAFQRQLMASGIRIKSVPERNIYADKIERFYASDQPVSIVLFPEFINREARVAQLAQDFLNDLIAIRTPIDGDVYRTIYVDTTNITARQFKRVTQGAEVPTAILSTNEHTVTLKKYGIRLMATYEAIRRIRIDMIRLHINLIGLQDALDRAGTLLDVAINGDGNNNAATNYNTSSIDSAVAAQTAITYKAWIGWLMKFYPYVCSTVAGNTTTLLQVLTMQFPGVDPLMLLAKYASQGSTSGMNVELAPGIFADIRLVLNNSLSDGVLVGLDKRFAIEEVSEIGANITETDKVISMQFNEIVMTEVLAYGVLYKEAIRTLTVA